jgi:hypothetical protein
MIWLEILINAGLPATAAWIDGPGQVQATFSRELTTVEWQAFLALTDAARARQSAARSEAALATAFRTITPAQAVAYIDNNVTSLATAKDALKLMARILIAMRDQIWPDLPDM